MIQQHMLKKIPATIQVAGIFFNGNAIYAIIGMFASLGATVYFNSKNRVWLYRNFA